MSYLDIGYDQFLNPINAPSSNQDQGIDPLEFDSFTDQISGDKIQGGNLSSPDGKTKLDLENGVFKINDGTGDLINLGLLPDGSIGLLIQDNQGNALMQIGNGKNFIQSASKTIELNFDDGQLLMRDDGGIVRVLLGLVQ